MSELIFKTTLTHKVESRNFSKCSSRTNKTCLNSFQRCCLFLYPPLFTAHLMAYLLHSFFIRRLLCGLITTIALLWNSRIITSFIVLIRVSVSEDLCYIFTAPTGKYMRAAPDRWSPRAAGKYLYAAVWRKMLQSHQLSCKSGVNKMQLHVHRLNKPVMQPELSYRSRIKAHLFSSS